MTNPRGGRAWIQREGRDETFTNLTTGRRDATLVDGAQPLQLQLTNATARDDLFLSVANTGDELDAANIPDDWSRALTWQDDLGPHLIEPSKGDQLVAYAYRDNVLVQQAALSLAGDQAPGQPLVASGAMADVPRGETVAFHVEAAAYAMAFGGTGTLVVSAGPAVNGGVYLGPKLLAIPFGENAFHELVSDASAALPTLDNAWPRVVRLQWIGTSQLVEVSAPFASPFVAPPPPAPIGAISYTQQPDGSGVIEVEDADAMEVVVFSQSVSERFVSQTGHLLVPPHVLPTGAYRASVAANGVTKISAPFRIDAP